MLTDLQPGARFKVNFNNRRVVGVLLETADFTFVPPDKLKPALECIDIEPAVQTDILALCQWASRYYQHPIGDVIGHALPTLLRQGEPAGFRQETHWRPSLKGTLTDPETLRKRSPKQADALTTLNQHPKGLTTLMLKSLNVATSYLRALEKKHLAEQFTSEPHAPEAMSTTLAEPELPLNSEQAQAFQQVSQRLGQFQSFLLNGVTGSGKTEVYLQLIQKVLERGEQALVLVPEIGLTPQTLHRFQKRFKCRIATMHSGLNNRERLDNWLYAKNGTAQIVIGTRSAIFTPFENLGIVIVDEEHDASFKQQDGFRYSARDLAVYRASQLKIPVVLGTATPCLETWVNAQRGRYNNLVLSQRAGNAQAPKIDIIDLRKQPMQDGFSAPLLESMGRTLEQGNQVLVFINRRGFAPTLMCHDCGWIDHCRHCDARLTIHRQAGQMRCHHCGYEAHIPRACPDCGSQDLLALGQGTEKIEETLTHLFPNFPVLRIDRDSTRRKDAMASIVQQVHQGDPMILVGTQMIAKGHHFPNVTLVAIKDADSGFFACDFRASEKMAQLIVQVAGRSGRAEKPGQVLLQSHQPEHPSIQLLIQSGYPAFVHSLLEERKLAELPPFSHQAMIRCDGIRMQLLLSFLEQIKQLILQRQLPIQVFGPVPAPMERKAGQFRAQLLLQASDRNSLHRGLAQILMQIEELRESRTVRWSVDVDPIDLS